MATVANWLDAATALPTAIENKFTKLPKLSSQLRKFDSMLPKGFTGLPNPPVFPTFGIDKLPAPPDLFGSPSGVNARLTHQRLQAQMQAAALARLPGASPARLSTDIPAKTSKVIKTTYTGVGM